MNGYFGFYYSACGKGCTLFKPQAHVKEQVPLKTFGDNRPAAYPITT